MADKQYYIKVTYEFGVDNEDGTFTKKNDGEMTWLSMDYNNVTLFNYYAIAPNLNNIIIAGAESGLMRSGNWPPPDLDKPKGKPA